MGLTLAELRAKPHLSVSQIKTFLQCPRKYRLQYIDKVRPSFRSIALVAGSAFHGAVGEHLAYSTPENPVPRERLYETFKKVVAREFERTDSPVLFDDEQSLGEVFDLGIRMIDAFVRLVPLPDEIRALELPFSVTLVDPETGEVLPLPLIGAVDVLAVEDGCFYVSELKTGKKKWSRDQTEFDLQPTAYRLGMRSLGIDPVHLTLIVTTKSKKAGVQIEELVRGDHDERDLFATAASMLRGIEAGVDHPVRGWPCRSCPYAGACP